MRSALLTFLALASPALAAPASHPAPVTGDRAEALRKASAEVLFWNEAQRDQNFRAMESIFPTHTVHAGRQVRPLPAGVPLPVDQAAVDAFMTKWGGAGLVVLQDGKVRLEVYKRGFSATQRWTSFSVAKSVTSTLIGIAAAQGKLRLDDPVTRFVPELRASAYDGVTVRQVLTMSSGVKWNEDYTDPNSDVARMFADPVVAGRDATAAYLRRLHRAAAPGTKWNYNTAETNLAGVVLARAVGMPLAEFAEQQLWKPFGMEADAFWQVDNNGQEVGGCCLSMRLRDYARIGEFMRLGGRAQGHALLTPAWVREATAMRHVFPGGKSGYGYFWWTRPNHYEAVGIFGQGIYVDPARHVVIALVSNAPSATDDRRSADREEFYAMLAKATER
jgi:CubicO group peptidase (beta-lactamase class C family)